MRLFLASPDRLPLSCDSSPARIAFIRAGDETATGLVLRLYAKSSIGTRLQNTWTAPFLRPRKGMFHTSYYLTTSVHSIFIRIRSRRLNSNESFLNAVNKLAIFPPHFARKTTHFTCSYWNCGNPSSKFLPTPLLTLYHLPIILALELTISVGIV